METLNKYTEEPIARFNQLYKQLLEDEKHIKDYNTKPHLQHPVMKKRFALIVLGEHLSNYEKEVPEDVRKDFGFDIKNLVVKINNLLN